MRARPLLFALLLLPACSEPGGSGAGAPSEAPRERVTGIPAPADPAPRLPALPPGADLVLAPEAEAGWRLRPLAHAPAYFLAKGWANARTLWGLSGTNALLVLADEPEFSVWSRDAWDASLSPGGSDLAWIDGRGVWVGDRSGEPRLLAERDRVSGVEGDLTGPLLWSPGGNRLLVQWSGEAEATFGVVEVPSGEVRYLPARGEGYLLVEPFGWLDPERILFTAQPRLSGDGDPAEWRGLAVYDRAADASSLVSRPETGQALHPLAPWGGGAVLVGVGSAETGEVEGIALIDTRAWTEHPVELPAGRRVAARDSTAVVVVVDLGESGGEREHGLLLWTSASGETLPLARVRGNDLRVAWSPTGGRLVVSRSVRVPVDGQPGSFREETRTHLLEPNTG
jgi:hypothetical protein